jgi:hypothetical protein
VEGSIVILEFGVTIFAVVELGISVLAVLDDVSGLATLTIH